MIHIVIGTRPEIIKIAPVVWELQNNNVPFQLIHSNQHYDKNLDAIFFDELRLPQPNYNLRVGSGSHAEQTAKIMIGYEAYCASNPAQITVVHGDTNTTLAAALVAKKLQYKLAHVEAGLRSFDEKMPEEINRCVVDRISNFLFTPTDLARSQLLKEGTDSKKIYLTGNTIVDLIHQTLGKISIKGSKNTHILLTAHRPVNVDSDEALQRVFSVANFVSTKLRVPIIWPIHPRTRERAENLLSKKNTGIQLIAPVSYTSMLQLIQQSVLILTDSGGIQEEAFVLKKPILTLRDTTERPETLSANRLVETSLSKTEDALAFYAAGKAAWSNILGDGTASKKIVQILQKEI